MLELRTTRTHVVALTDENEEACDNWKYCSKDWTNWTRSRSDDWSYSSDYDWTQLDWYGDSNWYDFGWNDSMTGGLYGLRYAIPSPGSPCNSFALTTLHCRRCRNWISLKSAETLFPSCRLPHYSYTHAEFNCFRRCGPDTVEILTGTAFKGDVATTGQTAQTMCIATTLSTAMEILNTGMTPISLFTNEQVNCWFTPRSALLRAFQMHWTRITLALDEPMVVI